ncbi:Os02g0229501 [Oryza sativa Japonica Group]|uniref:Os02g0229501 protein n=1 Tax=Oryza sativa subsp. japonica TaxID=39947 RepID=A0A0P0VGP9_ORYSJ|nr:hypothetical protein EE612_009919 [Oryza sativa]BAS77764.1 Os02g0229501 [Oryza sativa Japonica Group]
MSMVCNVLPFCARGLSGQQRAVDIVFIVTSSTIRRVFLIIPMKVLLIPLINLGVLICHTKHTTKVGKQCTPHASSSMRHVLMDTAEKRDYRIHKWHALVHHAAMTRCKRKHTSKNAGSLGRSSNP